MAADPPVWPDADKMPDEDPMDQMGHGTHVTGIIVGKNDWYGIHISRLVRTDNLGTPASRQRQAFSRTKSLRKS